MIKKLKKQSSNNKNSINLFKRYPSLRTISYIFPFFSLYIFLPIYLKILPIRLLFVLYLANTIIAFYLFNRKSRRENRLKIKSQDLQEKINILNDENTRELKNQSALGEKIKRYNSLKNIIEDINQNLDLNLIADNLASITFLLIAKDKGVCILYLVDDKTQKLTLFKIKKENRECIVKVKEGDIFDTWVLRHAQALFVEDVSRDFRFDLEKLKTQDLESISSLISSPFISSHRFLGILRLNNPEPNFYSQDDFRFLVTICDLGTVALENAQLFQRTRDLAIHDGLTSLFTKGYFLERLKEEYIRSIRQRSPLSLLMLDIDYFKNYNDKFGHTAGDIVLKNLSLTMVDFLKDFKPYIVSRFGGEEFCIILPGMDKEGAFAVGEQLRLAIEGSKIILRKQETHITVSIGVSCLPLGAEDAEGLIFKADQALYTAKQKGRNRIVCA